MRILENPEYEALMVCPDVHFGCERCGYSDGYSWLPGTGFCHPKMVAWEERHERIRLLPPRLVELDGRRSFETRWEAVTGNGAAIVINDLTSLKITRITCDGATVMEGEPE